jgi:hypothetical protein
VAITVYGGKIRLELPMIFSIVSLFQFHAILLSAADRGKGRFESS